MKDERYLFIQDSIEKKAIARNAFSRRTHAGGSGKKKRAAELMTNKELAKMNGELKTYRLNDPMTWAEFKALPDDIKVMYIKVIRERFDPPDNYLAKMLGVHPSTVMDMLNRLGMSHSKKTKSHDWDKEGFMAWATGEKAVEAPAEEVAEAVEEPKNAKNVVCEVTKKKAVPVMGSMKFEGRTEEILDSLYAILGGAEVTINVYWERKDGAGE